LSPRLLSKKLKIKIYKTVVLLVVLYLYGCDAWYLTLREERRLRVFENRILRQIFGPKKDAHGEWRRLHNKELNSLYRSPNIVVRVIKSRKLRWADHVAKMDEGRNAFNILTGTPAGKRLLERPRRRWEDNIRMDLKEIGIYTRNWLD
jgi:hypothetical protein